MAAARRGTKKPVDVVKGRPRKRPFIFISHDSRDAKIAEWFSDLFASKELGFFLSSNKKGQGLQFGFKFYDQVIEKIKSAAEVVCLLTPSSLYRPWIFYEAGLAAGKLRSRVLGVALGVPFERLDTTPFGQFQNCAYDEDSITTLVIQLLKHRRRAHPDRTAILKKVRLFMNKTSELAPGIRDPSNCPDFEGFSKLGMYRVDYKLAHEDLQRRLASSKRIQVLKTWFPETLVISDGLKEAIKKRAEVCLLLCKPGSILLRQRSRTAHKNDPDRGSQIVYRAIKDIHGWIKETPRPKVEIRCYDSWPGCPVIWYDNNNNNKILMGFYFRRDSSPEWPWINVEEGSELAKILKNQFDDLWGLPDNERLKTKKQREDWLRENERWDYEGAAPLYPLVKSESPRRKLRRKDKA